MKDIDEIRRQNLRFIESELGGMAEVARAVGMSPSQFANLRDGAKDSKTGKRRGMRKDTARRIETATGKPSGWLDIDHSDGEADASSPPPPWNAYESASASTQAAVDLLLLPRARRARLLSASAQATTAVELLELHAAAVLATSQKHHGMSG